MAVDGMKALRAIMPSGRPWRPPQLNSVLGPSPTLKRSPQGTGPTDHVWRAARKQSRARLTRHGIVARPTRRGEATWSASTIGGPWTGGLLRWATMAAQSGAGDYRSVRRGGPSCRRRRGPSTFQTQVFHKAGRLHVPGTRHPPSPSVVPTARWAHKARRGRRCQGLRSERDYRRA
jgi:hypothetical protein